MWVIDDGLKPDDQVIVEGIEKGEGRNSRGSQAREHSGGGSGKSCLSFSYGVRSSPSSSRSLW